MRTSGLEMKWPRLLAFNSLEQHFNHVTRTYVSQDTEMKANKQGRFHQVFDERITRSGGLIN